MAQQMLEVNVMDQIMDGMYLLHFTKFSRYILYVCLLIYNYMSCLGSSDYDFSSDEDGELSDRESARCKSPGIAYESDKELDRPPPTPSPEVRRSPSPVPPPTSSRKRSRERSPDVVHNSPLLRDNSYCPEYKRKFYHQPRGSNMRYNNSEQTSLGHMRWQNQHSEHQLYWTPRPLFDVSKIPRHEFRHSKMLVPSTGKLRPEIYTDRFVDAMVQNASRNCPVVEKKVRMQNLEESFAQLFSFFSNGVNKDQWLSIRYSAVFNSGLIMLTHLLDEQLTWASICLKHNRELSEDDILIMTSEKLCQQILTKLVDVIRCIEKDSVLSSVLKGVAESVCMRSQYLRAMLTVKKTPCNLPMYILFVYALAVPAIRTRIIRDPLMTQCKDVVLNYTPGDCMSLLKAILACHECNMDCTKCRFMLNPILGPTHRTSGLFFICE